MIEHDKKLHLLAGFATGILPAIVLPGAGTVVALMAGLAKEYDDGHGDTRGTVDKMDVAWTVAGGALADAWAFLAPLLLLL